MLNIGCHVSSSKGYVSMVKDTLYIGGNTFQWFTRNPRGGDAKPIDEEDFCKFLSLIKENGFAPLLAHAPYTLNAASSKEEVRDFALRVFLEDIKIINRIPGAMYNFHPGSHIGQGEEAGIKYIAEILNKVIKENKGSYILLETMAGKGTEIGKNFQEIRKIIDLLDDSSMIGVTLDTCHVYDGGYDIVNNLDGVLKEFDEIIGLSRLKAIHLNDSKNPFASHKDRHECIGKGSIGLDAFVRFINDPRVQGLPVFLETPNDLDGYKGEITLLKERYTGE